MPSTGGTTSATWTRTRARACTQPRACSRPFTRRSPSAPRSRRRCASSARITPRTRSREKVGKAQLAWRKCFARLCSNDLRLLDSDMVGASPVYETAIDDRVENPGIAFKHPTNAFQTFNPLSMNALKHQSYHLKHSKTPLIPSNAPTPQKTSRTPKFNPEQPPALRKVLLECGHAGLCVDCAYHLCRTRGPLCPICRDAISHVRRAHGGRTETDLPQCVFCA